MGGCDKTVPAQLMGAVSADRPAIALVAGPMMTGRHRGERLGACTDCRRFWARYRAGDVDDDEISEVEGQLAVTAGTCAVMGTASTMACLAEALGICLPGTAAIPAVHADRLRAAEATGAAAVKLIGSKLTPIASDQRKVGRECAARAARARRLDQCGHPSDRDRRPRRREGFARSSQHAVGHDAGAGQSQTGRQRLHGRLLRGRRHGRAAARTQAAAASRLHDRDRRNAGRAARRRRRQLRSIARSSPSSTSRWSRRRPGGAVRQPGAAGRHPQTLGGRRQICSSTKAARWCSRRWPISPRGSTIPRSTSSRTTLWCCRTPARMRRTACRKPAICRSRKSSRSKGVKDMVRISDARMSGTAFGTIVLHITPDAASGGPLGLVRNGDRIRLSVKERRIDAHGRRRRTEKARRRGAAERRKRRNAATPSCSPSKSSAPTKAAISSF